MKQKGMGTNKIFRLKYIGRFLAKVISKHTGGEFESKFYREYTKNLFNVDVGMYSYGSCFRSNFCSGGAVSVGRYCSLGNRSYYIGSNHLMSGFSTSPYFQDNYFLNKYNESIDEKSRYQSLEIGNDVWIGSEVIILAKCHHIGNGAVIGAGSIVTSDIPAYAVAVGNPAKVIKYRFDSETCELLEKSRWWELDPKDVMPFYQHYNSPAEFAKEIINYKNSR